MRTLCFVAIAFLVQKCAADCRFTLANHPYIPHFLEKSGSNLKYLNILNNELVVRPQHKIFATCQSEQFSRCAQNKLQNIWLYCDKQSRKFISQDGKVSRFDPQRDQLVCKKPIVQHYTLQELNGCKQHGVLSGYINREFPGRKVLVKLAEYCFDPLLNKVLFAHIWLTQRSNYLKDQHKYNEIFGHGNDGSILSGQQNAIDFYHTGPGIKLLDPGTSHGSDMIVNGYLLSSKIIAPQYVLAFNHSAINIHAVAERLENGNWRKYQNILEKRSQDVPLEIYAGTHEFLKKADSSKPYLQHETKVPKYIWNLIRQRGSPGIVLVAINVPMIKQENAKKLVFCEDICHTVPWLNVHSFKNATLGYIFCCKVDDALRKITDFPMLSKPIIKAGVSFETYDSNESGKKSNAKNEKDEHGDFSDYDDDDVESEEQNNYDEKHKQVLTSRGKSMKNSYLEDDDYESAESSEESSYELYLKYKKRFEKKRAR